MSYSKSKHPKNWHITKSVDIPEIQCILTELTHKQSGAEVMHIANDDEENLFCLSFKTHPDASDGVAHILEHTVLCGSKKFPIKDPFFAMMRRSLNTFMNALTGADFTCYPAASQIPKDFYNLLLVYLDAVFHPNLDFASFAQEGWRLEFARQDDASSPLEYKGVVYNEMKGALASPMERLHETLHQALFPDITYSKNSGGDPKIIPNLTYEKLKEFHKTHYHPSRCLFFFYGNIPLKKHLSFLEKHILKEASHLSPLKPIPKQRKFTKPKTQNGSYPMAEPIKYDDAIIAIGFLTTSIQNLLETLALEVLELALLGTDASPLKHAILQSGLCKNVSTFLENEYSEIPFVFVFKGCKQENSDKLKDLIFAKLKSIRDAGIDLKLIQASLHQIEFQRSEIVSDGAPYGLNLFFRSALLKQHGGHAEDGLRIHSLFHTLRLEIENDSQYFSKLIDKYFLKNAHFATTTLQPDSKLAEKEEQEEKARLANIKEKLSPKEIQNIIDEAKALQEYQQKQAHADISVLPKITLKDVPKKANDIPLSQSQDGKWTLFHTDVFTNNILYVDIVFDLPKLSEIELLHLPLLAMILPGIGFGNKSYIESLNEQQANTGGISVDLLINRKTEDFSTCTPSFAIHGKALSRKTKELFSIIEGMIENPKFDNTKRLKELLEKHKIALQNNVSHNAMKYAKLHSAKNLNYPSLLQDLFFGVSHYHFIKNLSSEGWIDVVKHLHKKVLSSINPHIVTSSHASQAKSPLHIPCTEKHLPWENQLLKKNPKKTGFCAATPVAFTSQIFQTIPFDHEDAANLALGAKILENHYLHTHLREMGGAYAGGAGYDPLAGQFVFFSYRDPNLFHTLNHFENAVLIGSQGKFHAKALQEAKLEILQHLDHPIAPGNRAHVAYCYLRENKTLLLRQAFRDRIFKAKKGDVSHAIKRFLAHNAPSTTTVGNQKMLEKENALFKGERFILKNL